MVHAEDHFPKHMKASFSILHPKNFQLPVNFIKIGLQLTVVFKYTHARINFYNLIFIF